MAQVEIQAGPHRFVSLLSREAADELGLEPGVLAVAAVKATSVSVEIPQEQLSRAGRIGVRWCAQTLQGRSASRLGVRNQGAPWCTPGRAASR